MIATIDLAGRRCIAWPLAVIGLVLSLIAGGFIRTAAFIADVKVGDDEQTL